MMACLNPSNGDLISFTDEQYPGQFLVGPVVSVNRATHELDVETCLSASADEDTHLVAFVPSAQAGPSGLTAADQSAGLQGELDELRERREVLQQDVTASHARMETIDVQIGKIQASLKAATASSPGTDVSAASAPPPSPEVTKADKGLVEARKGLQSSLKTAAADWTKLKTLGAPSKTDGTAKIVKGPPPPKEVVELVEAALAVLNSKSAGTTFRGVQPTLPESIKKCSMLKPDHVQVAQLRKADVCLTQYTSAALAKKAAPSALVSLYTWLKAMTASVKARAAQDTATGATDAARKSASPDPIKPAGGEEQRLQTTLRQLAQERKEHADYVELAEEELEAMDALVRETEAAAAAANSPSRLVGQTHAMRVAIARVVAVLPHDDRTLLAVEKAVLMAPGTSVTLPRQTLALIKGQPTPGPSSAPTTPPKSLPAPAAVRRASLSGPLNGSSPLASLSATEGDAAGAVAPLSEDERARLNAHIQELEANLNLALYKNPAQAEVQLLREELKAKASDLERLTEERDKLLQEKRERPRGSSMLMARARPEMEREFTTTTYASPDDATALDASSRPRVDRRVADELEDQLNAAHQRIRELERQQQQQQPTLANGTAAPSDRLPLGAASTGLRRDSDKAPDDTVGLRQPFSPVGMLSRTLPEKSQPHSSFEEHETLSLQSGGIGAADDDDDDDDIDGTNTNNHDNRSALEDVFRRVPAPPPVPVATSFVSPDVQQEFEARLAAVRDELEQQKRQTMMAEERLNLALHAQQESQQVSEAQKKELKTVWKRLEDAESLLEKERFQAAIAMRRQSMLDEMSYPSISPSLPNQAGSPSLPNVMPTDDLGSGIVPTSKSAAAAARLQMSGQSNSQAPESHSGRADRSSPPLEVPATDPLQPSASMGSYWYGVDNSSRRGSAPPGRVMSVGRRDTRAGSLSVPLLNSAPVEQMTPVELRHEVRNLRAEVERVQSSERRLMTELSDMQAKQKEERRQRREARRARMNMMAMMENAVSAALVPPAEDHTEQLLNDARSETESIRSRNPSGMSYRS